MRSIIRNFVVFSFAAALVFFCSCERHKVGELPDHQEHGKPGEPHGTASGHAQKDDGHGHGKDDGHGHAAPSPIGTPAQFFPASSPAAPVPSPAPM